MAKIAYSKLGLNKIVNKDPIIIEFNDQQVEIIQYLPIEKKLELISEIVNASIDNNSYYNSCRLDMFFTVNMINTYANISITEKQKEDLYKFYDQIICSGFAEKVLENIPKKEYDFIYTNTLSILKSVYKYKNSALGILEAISSDYSDLNFDASEIQQKLSDPENLELLKSILTKLG